MQGSANIGRKTRRNEKLAARFYFYNHLLCFKFERCLELLEQDFDISQATVTDILYSVSGLVDCLAEKQFTAQQLQSVFPEFNWSNQLAIQSRSYNSIHVSLS